MLVTTSPTLKDGEIQRLFIQHHEAKLHGEKNSGAPKIQMRLRSYMLNNPLLF